MKSKWRQALVMISLIGFILGSCATEGKIRIRASSDIEAIKIFEKETQTSPVWSSYPVIDFNGDEVRNRMLMLIEKAEEYILINSFLLMYDDYGSIILDALRKKHDGGVAVYVIADSSNYFVPGRSGFNFLRENNIPFAEYNPIRLHKLFFSRSVLYRDHRKFWIVDGKYIYIGGCNIINSSLTPESEGGNVDGMVLVESAAAAEIMIKAFTDTWNAFSSNKLNPSMIKVPKQSNYDTRIFLFNQKARLGNDVMADMTSGLFSTARSEVWIIQPYTFINSDILKTVRKMTQRGVDVNIVLSKHASHRKFHHASYYGMKDLMEAGANVWVYAHPYSPLHYKAFIIDDRWFSIGSANFNQRSFKYSDEANIVFHDPDSFAILYSSFDKIRQFCRKISREEALFYRSYSYRRWHRIMQFAG